MNRRSYALQVGYAALRGQAAEMQGRLRAREERIRTLRSKVAAMKGTWSWRLTRPLRRLARALGR